MHFEKLFNNLTLKHFSKKNGFIYLFILNIHSREHHRHNCPFKKSETTRFQTKNKRKIQVIVRSIGG